MYPPSAIRVTDRGGGSRRVAGQSLWAAVGLRRATRRSIQASRSGQRGSGSADREWGCQWRRGRRWAGSRRELVGYGGDPAGDGNEQTKLAWDGSALGKGGERMQVVKL